MLVKEEQPGVEVGSVRGAWGRGMVSPLKLRRLKEGGFLFQLKKALYFQELANGGVQTVPKTPMRHPHSQ